MIKRLWFLALLLLIGYAVLAWRFPLWGRGDQLPLADMRAFAPTLAAGLLYALLVCALFALYWLAYRCVQESSQPPPWWSLGAVTLCFGLPLVLTYPLNAVDLFRYFYEGRMMVEYGVNPLTTPPNALAGDPLLPFAAILLDKTSPYGPLWELLGAWLYWLSGGVMMAGLVLFKACGLAAHLAAGMVIWRILAKHDARTRSARLLLWLWNPALLFMFVMDAHNDILMLLFLLLGYQQIVRRRSVAGLLLLAAAVLVKPIGLLPIPIFALMAWQQAASRQAGVRLFLFAAVGAVMLATMAFLPFGSPWPLLQRLQHEAQSAANFSPAAFILAAGRWLDAEVALSVIAQGAALLFALIALLLLWLTWRGRNPLRGAADIFAAYLFTALRFRIWYPTWLFPWIVLDTESRFRLYTVYWLLLLSQLSPILYGHLRVEWFGGSLDVAHLLGVPFVFGMSLLIGLFASRDHH